MLHKTRVSLLALIVVLILSLVAQVQAQAPVDKQSPPVNTTSPVNHQVLDRNNSGAASDDVAKLAQSLQGESPIINPALSLQHGIVAFNPTATNTVLLSSNFEDGSFGGWTVVNGSQVNKWFVGTAAGSSGGGSYAAFISNNSSGATYNYDINPTSVVHFYQDIAFPAGETLITLTFNWKGYGESTYDYLRVFLVPTTTTPVAGTQLTGQLATYNLQTTWQTTTITLPASAAGTTQRLVFSWRNDGSLGTQPPGAVDNVVINTDYSGDNCSTAIPLGTLNIPASYSNMVVNRDGETQPTGTSDYNSVATPSSYNLTYAERCYSFTAASTGWVQIGASDVPNNARLVWNPTGTPVTDQCWSNPDGSSNPEVNEDSSAQWGSAVTAGQNYCFCVDSGNGITVAGSDGIYDLDMFYWPPTTQTNTTPATAATVNFSGGPTNFTKTYTGLSTANAGNDAQYTPTGALCASKGQDLHYKVVIPAGCSCTSLSVTQTAPDLGWSSDAGAAVCDAVLQYGTTSFTSGLTNVDNENPGSSETFTVNNPAPGSTYYVNADQYLQAACPNFDLTFSLNGCTGTAGACAPLAVTLADFAAAQQGSLVQVTWETTTEQSNRGFNLYRSTNAAAPEQQLNAALIPSQAQGSPSGFLYTWDDSAGLVDGQTYWYWLEDVDVNGVATLHGPVSVAYAVPTAVTLDGVQAGSGARTTPWLLLLLIAGAAVVSWQVRRLAR